MYNCGDILFYCYIMRVVLCILDGWGCKTGSEADAIYHADTVNFDYFMDNYPNCKLYTSGNAVGLPDGQMGNSEVGHSTIGSGRVIKQDLIRINEGLENNIDDNIPLNKFIEDRKNNNSICHIVGICSDGGVHGHQDHMVKIANHLISHDIKVYLHLITDGRDTQYKSALEYINKLLQYLEKGVKIMTISGRCYAMDRDKNWDRTNKYSDAVLNGIGQSFSNIEEVISDSYKEEIFDEFIIPHTFEGYSGIQEGDGIIFTNFRADRMIQMIDVFSKDNRIINMLSMIKYSNDFTMPIMFPRELIDNTLGELISLSSMKQLRIAETEKYAHVTYFFNAGKKDVLFNEDRIMIPSPKVFTYNLHPDMSARKVSKKLLEAMNSKEYDFILVNFANPDMVGHTGDFSATVEAISCVDKCLGDIYDVYKKQEEELCVLVTADHGNAEHMFDLQDKTPHTSHTTGPVPFIVLCNDNIKLKDGTLANIAATVCKILKIPIHQDMKESLIK